MKHTVVSSRFSHRSNRSVPQIGVSEGEEWYENTEKGWGRGRYTYVTINVYLTQMCVGDLGIKEIKK